jgi:DNA-binding transcriptional ArsR family regulator
MPAPHVRDLSARRQLQVEIDEGPAYEALMALVAFAGEEPVSSYEVGQAWFRAARRRASPELRRDLRALVGRSGWLLISLGGIIRQAPGRTVTALLEHLRQMSPQALRKALAEPHPHGGAEAAAAARRFDRLSPGDLKRLLEAVLERWYEDVFREQEADFMRVISADARAKKRLIGRLSPLRLIEQATNGITYEQEPGITSAVLIPSVINRPWVTISEAGTEKYFFYPAAKPGEPPERRLATVYNALGDQTRLRIVKRLAQGPAGLTELAEELGLAKSTVHQHIVVLRDARIVQILLGAAKGNRLADDRPDLEQLLKNYLDSR